MAKAQKEKTVQEPKSNEVGQKAITEIRKKFGQGAIMTLGSRGPIVAIGAIPTGDIGLDIALGVGGVPRGRVIEIFGPESSGKTTLTLSIIKNAQLAGGVAAFIDAEHALDPAWAKRIGVNVDSLLISQPDSAEQALEIVEILVRGGDISVIVIDSVAALIPRAEIEGEMGDSHMGLQARLMSQALRKLTGIVSKSNTTVIFINQLREKIGVMFGNPETTPGGKALKFYASVRIDVRKAETVKEGDKPIGNKVKLKVVKNKVAPPFQQAIGTIFYGDPVAGFDAAASLQELGLLHGIIESSGSWKTFDNIRLGNGTIQVSAFIRENPDLAKEIRERVFTAIQLTRKPDLAGFDAEVAPDSPPKVIADHTPPADAMVVIDSGPSVEEKDDVAELVIEGDSGDSG